MEPGAVQLTRSVVVAAPAETLYDMVADVTRMGEWSPACTGGTWDDGASAEVGAWFTGHNRLGEHSYDTRCEITAAERPSTVAWMAQGAAEGFTEWRYSFAPVEGGTEVTETWKVIRPFPGDRVDEDRQKMMREHFGAGMEQTLARLKAAVEG